MKTLLILSLVGSLNLTGCTAQDKTIANTALSAAPVVASGVCAGITASVGSGSGTVCGTVQTDVSAVAQLVEAILASLPASRKAGDSATGAKSFTYKGVTVTLPSSQADAVWSEMKSRGLVS